MLKPTPTGIKKAAPAQPAPPPSNVAPPVNVAPPQIVMPQPGTKIARFYLLMALGAAKPVGKPMPAPQNKGPAQPPRGIMTFF